MLSLSLLSLHSLFLPHSFALFLRPHYRPFPAMNNPKTATNPSLEACFQACSINSGGSSPENHASGSLELNSHISLPYQWEQCLDLKTGEIYYIDWSNGTKAKDDPRTWLKSSDNHSNKQRRFEVGFCSEDESFDENEGSGSSCSSLDDYLDDSDDVLVVAGCKRCLMYFMMPKMALQCPKCRNILMHFNGSGKALL